MRKQWRLRKQPNQKGLNGKPPGKEEAANTETPKSEAESEAGASQPHTVAEADGEQGTVVPESTDEVAARTEGVTSEALSGKLENLDLSEASVEIETRGEEYEGDLTPEEDDGEGEWISTSLHHASACNSAADPQTSSKQHQEIPSQRERSDGARTTTTGASSRPGNFRHGNAKRGAQNKSQVSMFLEYRKGQANRYFSLLDSGLSRITFLKTWVLRCHGCWKVCKDTTKQFCPSCGQATLTRVSCSTDAAGNFKLHLKKNFQFNNRGNVYSIPKPTHGTANGKGANVKGGGKNGWGRELILAEDQKEYIRKRDEERRTKHLDLMDSDYLPGILGGARGPGHGRIKVGAGRNINAKRKR